jgi:uroporphyrin-3 C-methyltransferase
MTDLTQSPDDKPIDVEDAVVIEEPSPTSKKPAKTGFLWFITLINLLILILLCAGAYWYYTQIASVESSKQSEVLSIQQNLDDQGRSLQGNINQLKQNNQSLENKLSDTQQSNQQALAKVQQSVNNAQQKIENNAIATQSITKRLAEMSGRRPSDWLLAEANYLVNMASRKLYLEKDIRTAVTLLREADARLDDLNDPSLFSVRALIAADIQTLSQVNSVSTDSIALTLAGMLPKVSELPLDTLQLPESNIEQDLTLSEDVNDWRQNLSKTWKSIVNDLISIDYVDKPLEPYLAERQQWLIEQQLKHAIAQAQTAALNEQIDLYRSAIQQGIDIIVEHYQLENSQVSQFLGVLKELQSTDFSRNYPSSLSSPSALKDILEQRVKGLFNANDNDTLGMLL